MCLSSIDDSTTSSPFAGSVNTFDVVGFGESVGCVSKNDTCFSRLINESFGDDVLSKVGNELLRLSCNLKLKLFDCICVVVTLSKENVTSRAILPLSQCLLIPNLLKTEASTILQNLLRAPGWFPYYSLHTSKGSLPLLDAWKRRRKIDAQKRFNFKYRKKILKDF